MRSVFIYYLSDVQQNIHQCMRLIGSEICLEKIKIDSWCTASVIPEPEAIIVSKTLCINGID